jgi:hypothetical protein
MDDFLRIQKVMKPFIIASVETGGLASGTLVRELVISQLDSMEDEGCDSLFAGGLDRWLLSGFIENDLARLSSESGRLNISEENQSTVKKAIEVVSLILDNYALMPSLDLASATDFSLGFCMVFWGLHGDVKSLESNLEFLLHYAKAKDDTWAKTILEETLDEIDRFGSNDVSFILVEAESRTPLLQGIHAAASIDVNEFSEILAYMNSLRADQLLMIANHAAFTQNPDAYE